MTRVSSGRYNLLGMLSWITASVLFFVAHLVVQSKWKDPEYSWADNNISDLGNIYCQVTEGRYICSPAHGLFNTAVMLGGILIVLGVVFMRSLWRKTLISWLARFFIMAAGLGWFLAGKFPFDIDENLHVLGALLILVFGNIGLIMSHWAFNKDFLSSTIRNLTLGLGILGLVSGFLHFSGYYLGLGMGGMERVSVFPLPIWLLMTGIAIRHQLKLRSHNQNDSQLVAAN